MRITGYDQSFQKPTAQQLLAARAGFVGCYVGGDPAKTLTASYFAALCAAHIPLILLHETTADWMLGGYQAGIQHAAQAREGAQAAGVPDTVPIYAAADFPATDQQIPAVMAAASGFASVESTAHTGVYGPLHVVQHAADAGYRTLQTSAWSDGQWDPADDLRQTGRQIIIGTATVDVDQAFSFDFGQYTPPPPPWPGRIFTYHPNAPQIHGTDVRAWQQRMADRGWNLSVDGWYGQESETVARAFQTEFHTAPGPGLAEDGEVGPRTWAGAYTIPITT
jgi:hypothetical protein